MIKEISPVIFIGTDFTKEPLKETLELLTAGLRCPNLAVRHKACEVLLKNFREASFLIFMDALEDRDWYVRSEALWALGVIRDKKAEDAIVKALSDEERKVSSVAARVLTDFGWVPGNFPDRLRYYFALGNFGELTKLGDQAFDLLINSLKNVHKSWDLACKSAMALGIIGDRRAGEPLLEVLDFDNTRVQARVAQSLGKLQYKKALIPLIELLKKTSDAELQMKIIEALGNIKDEKAFNVISIHIKSLNPEIRLSSVKALASIGCKEAIEPLYEIILKDKNFEIRREAIKALGNIKSSVIITFLIDLMNKGPEELQEAIIETFIKCPDQRALPLLLEKIESPDPEIRFLSVRALGKIENMEAYEALIKTLKDEDWRVLGEAIRALGRLNFSLSVSYLRSFLYHKRSYIRRLAVQSLAKIGGSAADELPLALKDKHNYVRMLSVLALDNLGWKPDNIEREIDYYFARRDYSRILDIPGGAEVLIKGLGDNYSLVKEAVENFILSSGNKAEEILSLAFNNSDPKIREGAIKLMARLRIGEKSLLIGIKDPNSSVRRACVKSLREFYPHTHILEGLTVALNDSDPGVRMTAEKALKNIKNIKPSKDIQFKYNPPDILSYEDLFEDIEYSYDEMTSSMDEVSENRKPEGRNVMELCNKMENNYYPEKYINIVLFEPKIPPNTGNIARLCAGTGSKLYLVGNLGFSFRDRFLKRAGLDYWHLVRMYYYPSMDDLYRDYPEGRFFYFTSNVSRPYTTVSYKKGDFLVFGPESPGLPARLLNKNTDKCLAIPMWKEARSFNLSTSVGIALYEALRQLNNSWLE